MGEVHTKRLKNWSIIDSCWWRKRCVSTINLSYLRIVSQTFRSTEVYLRPTSFWSEESKLQMRVSRCEHYSSVIAHNSRLTFKSVNGKKKYKNNRQLLLDNTEHKGQMKSGAPIATQERSKGNLGLFLVNFGALNLVGSNVVNSQGDKGHFQTPIPVFGVVVLLGGMNFHFVWWILCNNKATMWSFPSYNTSNVKMWYHP